MAINCIMHLPYDGGITILTLQYHNNLDITSSKYVLFASYIKITFQIFVVQMNTYSWENYFQAKVVTRSPVIQWPVIRLLIVIRPIIGVNVS